MNGNLHGAKKFVEQRYCSNEASSVKRYQVSESGALLENGYYAAKSLSIRVRRNNHFEYVYGTK